MSAETVRILVESKNFKQPPSKKKKTYGSKTETDTEKRRKFQWTKEWLNTY